MLTTLKATIQGDRIQWLEDSETIFPPTRLVQALITPLENSTVNLSPDEKAQHRLAALKKLNHINAFSHIQDPVAWQQETRLDRELPGREL